MKNKVYKNVIFSSSPGDIPYAISLYKKCTNSSIIIVLGITNYKVYKRFFKHIKIKYVQAFSLRNPFNIIRQLYLNKNFFYKYLRFLKKTKIFFHSTLFDINCAYFLQRLSSENILIKYNVNITPYTRIPTPTFKYPQVLLTKSFFGLDTKFFKQGSSIGYYTTFPRLQHHKRIHLKKPINSVQKSFCKKVSSKKQSQKKILFLESNEICDKRFQNYNNFLCTLLKSLKTEGYNMTIKPHPRHGCSKILYKLDCKITEQDQTVEFLDVNQFIAILGYDSLGLAKIQSVALVISLIFLLPFKLQTNQNYAYRYLNSQPLQRIKFPKNRMELYALLKNEKNFS